MAIYHLHAKTWSKGAGKGAGGHARYVLRQGPYATKTVEQVDGATVRQVEVDRAAEVAASFSGHMPAWAAENPLAYWDAADEHERANGTVYRELEFALPGELSVEQNFALAHAFAEALAKVDGGATPYSLAIHRSEKDPALLHCHLMLSDKVHDGHDRSPERWFRRAANRGKDPASGGAPKTQARISQDWLGEMVRPMWSDLANAALEQAGRPERIDHRALEEQRQEQEQLAEQAREKGDHLAAARHHKAADALDRPAQPKRGRVLEHGGPERAPGQAQAWDRHLVDLAERQAARQALAAAEQESERLRAELERERRRESARRELEASHGGRPDTLAIAQASAAQVVALAQDHRQAVQERWTARRRERGVAELLRDCDPAKARSLDRRIEALREAAQPVSAAERQRIRNSAATGWEIEQAKHHPEWLRAARGAGGWESLPQRWAERQDQEAGGWLAWLPERRKKAQEWDKRLRALDVLLKQRQRVMDAAERERLTEQKRAAAEWERLLPFVEDARNAFEKRQAALEAERRAAEREEQERKRREAARRDRATGQERGPGIRHPDKPRWQAERERVLTRAYNAEVADKLGRWYRIERGPEGLTLSNRDSRIIDYGDRVTAKEGNDKEIEAMVLLAQAKGWQRVELTGSAEFQGRAARALVEAGIGLTDARQEQAARDAIEADRRKAAREQEAMAAQAKVPEPTKPTPPPQAKAPERTKPAPSPQAQAQAPALPGEWKGSTLGSPRAGGPALFTVKDGVVSVYHDRQRAEAALTPFQTKHGTRALRTIVDYPDGHSVVLLVNLEEASGRGYVASAGIRDANKNLIEVQKGKVEPQRIVKLERGKGLGD
jgi:hypothetical protein